MEMINDTLKLKSYGWKKDMTTKQPHIQQVISNQQQYYPPDQHGVIDEWDALMKQQYDQMSKREQMNLMMDKERKKQYHDYLDFQTREKQRLKLLEEGEKRKDLSEVGNNLVTMQSLTQARNGENKALKSLMAHQWIEDMEKNKQKRAQNRAKELADDLARIEQEKALQKNEQDKERQKAQKWLHDTEDMIQFRRFVKDKEQEQQLKEHEKYVKGCEDQNGKRNQQQDQWYKRYRDFDQNLTQKMNDHEMKYMNPLKEKEVKDNEKIRKELEMAEKAKWERAQQDSQHKKDVAKQIYDGNLDRLGMKQQQLERNKEKDRLFLEQKQLESEAARQKEMQDSQNIKNQQDVYKQTLFQQMALKDQTHKSYGKMTFQEKRLNRADLDHYKNYDNSVTSLIPGINHMHTIGSRPLAKGALSQLYFGGTPVPQQKGHIWMFPTTGSQSQVLNPHQNGQQQQNSDQSMHGSFIGGVPGGNLNVNMNRSMSQSRILTKHEFESVRHASQTPNVGGGGSFIQVNPILQPIDQGITNPYIKREMSNYYTQNNMPRAQSYGSLPLSQQNPIQRSSMVEIRNNGPLY